MMTQKIEHSIYVYADWQGLTQATLIGILHTLPSQGKIIFSFEYEKTWLEQPDIFTLDPSLQLFHGRQYPPEYHANFGIFLDSSPDRWGRFLINRRETQMARQENRKPRALLEPDYLLGVFDQYRVGALRFKTNPHGPFLDDHPALASPPWTSLRELEHASLALETPQAEKNIHYEKWLNMLIAPGGSLGGARPKASVIDAHQCLWIAKFPSQQDIYDIGVWEMLAHTLAKKVGIITAKSQIKKLNSQYHTFLNQRFDRNHLGQRRHFASAMTLLQRSDGDDASKGASYLELAEFLTQQGARPTEDLEQLWRRIVFYVCISNTDDHLRNHGFLFEPRQGWILSPAFDINPDSTGEGLKLNISEYDNTQDLSLAKEVAEYFRLKSAKADEIIQQTVKAVGCWRQEANRLGISSKEQDFMAPAFRIADAADKCV